MKTKPEGPRYGHLTVIEHHHTYTFKEYYVGVEDVRIMLCKCDCGRETLLSEYRLTEGLDTNCGCGL